ncbi:MAG TPA: Ku protein [Tepidisphaeraceae bacterium]|nr:Ku protein [Tepidisphaeraceae bacterium]
MASRPVWSGFLRFSLVAVPVKAYTSAASGGGEVSLNQLHKGCNSRIQYKKTCPVHGEVRPDEIVSGYEFDKGRYVVIDPDEVDKLRSPADKAINVAAFVPPEQFDARYHNGKHHFLLPDGPVGAKTYALLVKAMAETNRHALAQVVMSGKEQLVVVRPTGNLLVMTGLAFEQELKPLSEFEGEAPAAEVAPAELAMSKTLIEMMSAGADFDYAAYRNTYTDKLTAVIEAKLAGKQVVTPPEAEQPAVANLMEALAKSVAEAKSKAKKGTGRPPLLTAPSAAPAKAAGAKRKKA